MVRFLIPLRVMEVEQASTLVVKEAIPTLEVR
jgi:hypothetical protein